jgi:hypothetical protein
LRCISCCFIGLQDHRRKVSAAAAAAAATRAGSNAAFTGFGRTAADRDAAAQERQRKAEAAAAESARILREEQAKDSNWRAAMMQQVEQVRQTIQFVSVI